MTSDDINFQERENLDFLQYEGPTDPTIQGSLGNIFKYKGFALNVFMTYSLEMLCVLTLCSLLPILI